MTFIAFGFARSRATLPDAYCRFVADTVHTRNIGCHAELQRYWRGCATLSTSGVETLQKYAFAIYLRLDDARHYSRLPSGLPAAFAKQHLSHICRHGETSCCLPRVLLRWDLGLTFHLPHCWYIRHIFFSRATPQRAISATRGRWFTGSTPTRADALCATRFPSLL